MLRSCIEPTAEQRAADPLAVQAQDYWELQIDAEALAEPLPPINGLKPVAKFRAALERKLFTYNAGNAAIAYLGVLRGHQYLSEAATDPMILEVAQGVYEESGAAVVRPARLHGGGAGRLCPGASLRKYQDATIVDPLERNVRDPLRKLGRHDRLIGPACLALEYGIRPVSPGAGHRRGAQIRQPAGPVRGAAASAPRHRRLGRRFGKSLRHRARRRPRCPGARENVRSRALQARVSSLNTVVTKLSWR